MRRILSRLRGIWASIERLDQAEREIRSLQDWCAGLQTELERLEQFRSEIASDLEHMRKAANVFSSSAELLKERSKLDLDAARSAESIEEAIAMQQAALRGVKLNPAIGSREISARQNEVVAIERTLTELEGRKRRLS